MLLLQIYDAAVRGLSAVESPFPVRFPLPDPRDLFSLKPGSLALHNPESKAVELDKSSSLNAAIAGARAAATQFSKKDQNTTQKQDTSYLMRANQPETSTFREVETASFNSDKSSAVKAYVSNSKEQTQPSLINESISNSQSFRTEQRPRPIVSSKVR